MDAVLSRRQLIAETVDLEYYLIAVTFGRGYFWSATVDRGEVWLILHIAIDS